MWPLCHSEAPFCFNEGEPQMPCDRVLKPQQTISERATEIRGVVARVVASLTTGRVKAKVGPQGAIAFIGLTDAERDGVTDACMFRRILATGSATAKAAIMRAEQIAGRSVDRSVVASGGHYHGDVYHEHKG
jgi:hypothetical protein